MITLTPKAAKRVQKFIANRGAGIGLRLGLKKSGCSGFAYVVDYADTLQDGDQVYESNGAKVIVNAKDLPYLGGTEIDFVREGLNETFQFRNPNEVGRCGCGESFAV